MKIASKEDFLAFVDVLIEDESMDVEGVKAKGEKFVFGTLESADELRLDYDVTILPPKKYFLPQREPLMTFDLSQPFSVKKVKDQRKQVIIGVHPYDIVAIRQMDTYFLDTNVDDSYLERRKNTVIIGLNVVNVAEKAFFGDMGTGVVDSGYDLMLTDLDDSVAIEVGTEAGANLLNSIRVREATPEEILKVKTAVEKTVAQAKRDLAVTPQEWHDLLEQNYDSPVWKEQAEKCLSCGTCTLVCPTCFCYDVTDVVSLDMKTGKRIRTWDGCLLRNFTAVGSGEIFREKTEDRYKHRYNRKGRYLPDMLGFVACVGCGRCSTQCVPDIADPVTTLNMVAEAASTSVPTVVATPLTAGAEISSLPEHPLYVPRSATVRRVEKLSEWETLFEIELDDGKSLKHQPGQFVEVSVMGYGEAPLSVTSAPADGNTFELAARKVGDVTSRLHQLNPGDKIGIRGPFGKGFDLEALRNKNILIVAGGIGIIPVRSLINYVFANRKDFGEFTILYGCKKPCELLFGNEVAEWDNRDDVQHLRSVDACPEGECWDGEVGLITCLIPKATFDPKNTTAIIVGPPVMYRFVINDLITMGMPEENVIVSLERRMKCGVGKCGHCQINGVYVCKEGPVFNYKDIKDLPEAFA
jgi:sulfite reductase subunit B